MSINHLIKILPFHVKQSIKNIYGFIPPRIRYGKVFWDTYNFLQESQWWSREKLEDYQLQQLRKLLHHAYDNVPYYRRIFDERGLKPKDIQSFDDMKKLPYLTKDIFKQHFSELISKNVKLEKAIISDNCHIRDNVIIKGNEQNLVIIASYVQILENITISASNKVSLSICHHEIIKESID